MSCNKDAAHSPAEVSTNEASQALLPYLLTEEEASGLLSTASAVTDSDGSDTGDSFCEDGHKANTDVVDPLLLPSGSITYDLYRWHRNSRARQSAERQQPRWSRHRVHSRSASIAECFVVQSEPEWDLSQSHSQLNMPGGFRRHYMHQKAIDEGRATSVLTASFVDFLALFGHFAGGSYPSDEDDDDENEDDDEGNTLSTYGSTDSITRRRLFFERKHAVQTAPAISSAIGNAPVGHRGASTQKTFFLLIKSFIGSGVLFLPRAFYNGGLLFSSILMLVVAAASLYTMLLLVKCYERVHCGYGEMGRRLYGKWMERVVLVSIVVSQVGFSCAGAIFVATNMRDLFNAATGCRYRLGLNFW
ncbi:hypothetical protein IWW38_003662, partial [Coemansia aciculifera]